MFGVIQRESSTRKERLGVQQAIGKETKTTGGREKRGAGMPGEEKMKQTSGEGARFKINKKKSGRQPVGLKAALHVKGGYRNESWGER